MISRIIRLLKIIRVIGRYRLDELISSDVLAWPLSVLLKMNPWKIVAESDIDRGTRLRRGLEELGPVFIKFGQALSTRRDLLPMDIADELVKLVDIIPIEFIVRNIATGSLTKRLGIEDGTISVSYTHLTLPTKA